jgi:phage-related tail protein
MALGVVPGDPDSAAKAFTDLKDELAKEKASWEAMQIDVGTLTQAVESLKISADKFAAHIPILEEKVKHLDNKVIDRLNELRA